MSDHPNPLAIGQFCDVCGTRINGGNYVAGETTPKPCPFGPHEEVPC